MQQFSRGDDGSVHGVFTTFEAELLAKLANELCGLLEAEIDLDPELTALGFDGGTAVSADPAVARLLPDAYPDDAEASQEFRRFTEHSLAGRKLSNARELARALDAGGEIDLTPADQQAWLRTLTDLRLVLAARLGIEKDDHETQPRDDDELMMYDIYDWLGSVQGSLVHAVDA
jgi:hypothetical protein